MPVLQPNEYDQSYFDGKSQSNRHNAGYSKYSRFYRHDLGSVEEPKESKGEYWLDYTDKLISTYDLSGKRVLEVGCAKGFVVEDLRAQNIDAHGIDVSRYAYDKSTPNVKPFLMVGDARSDLSKYKDNEFDVLFSLRFMTSIENKDIPNLIKEFNRISRHQFHIIDEEVNENFYNSKSLVSWSSYLWEKGTILVSNNYNNNEII